MSKLIRRLFTLCFATAVVLSACSDTNQTITSITDDREPSVAVDKGVVADESAPAEVLSGRTEEVANLFRLFLVPLDEGSEPDWLAEAFPLWKSSVELVAVDDDGEGLFSGNQRSPYFGFELREWEQVDGSHALNILINNRSDSGGQCGTEIRGVLVGLGDGRVEFLRDEFPVVAGGHAWSGGDAIECGVYPPVEYARLFDGPFIVDAVEPNRLTIRTSSENITFEEWVEPLPVKFELECPGQSQSSTSEVDWPETGPESFEEAIAGYFDRYPQEFELRPDWIELTLADITFSETSASGYFVDADNIVRLILSAESNNGIWLVTGNDSCSPG